jgi:hypothetical protein
MAGDAGQRQVYVDLDGQRIATLLDRQSISLDIAPGTHRVKLNNTLVTKTLEFTATAGETVHYQFANRPGRFGLPFMALMGVAPLFLSIERVTKNESRNA